MKEWADASAVEPGCGLLLLGLFTLGLALIPFNSAKKERLAQIRKARPPQCVLDGPGQAGELKKKDGTHLAIEFAKDSFGLAFLDANRSKVVNADYALLERAVAARPAVQKGAARAALATKAPLTGDEVIRNTVEAMEAARGPSGRRMSLESGLADLKDEQARRRLLLEASRIEVAAVLDKVDGLKTAAAKRRNLTTAIEALKQDDVPDDLQAEQMRWLQEALDAVDKAE